MRNSLKTEFFRDFDLAPSSVRPIQVQVAEFVKSVDRDAKRVVVDWKADYDT